MQALGTVAGVAAGLALFFIGVSEMTRGFKAVAGARMQQLLEKGTRNRFSGLFSGFTATVVFDSSSITIITLVSLVSAGLVTFAHSLAVIMGANIGTTVSSQIVAFNLTKHFGVIVALGAALRFLGKSERQKSWGVALIGLGLVFLGLEHLEAQVEPLKKSPTFLGFMERLDNPLFGVAVGALVTAVIQSSSATVGMAVVLAGQGALSLPAGIAVMMGAEIGTCVDVLLATLGRTRPAVRAGLFQLLFNVANLALLIGFTGALASAAVWITPGTDSGALARQIANAHVLFNVTGVALALPFTRTLARTLERLVPDRAGDADIVERLEARPGIAAAST